LRICRGSSLIPLDVAAFTKVDPDQMAEQTRLCLRHVGTVPGGQQWCDAVFDLVSGGVYVVAFADLKPAGNNIAQQSIGLVRRQRIGASVHHADRLGPQIDPVFEFAK
jgi:hypothetical protein